MSSTGPFKVIVIGGGPVGLTAAHVLSRAGIDFVLLERRPTAVIETGSDLVLLPMGMRILSQLGLYERLLNVGAPLNELQRMDHSGRPLGTSRMLLQLGVNHGYRPQTLSRHSLTSVLYNSLTSDLQDKILPNKQVSNIEMTTDGVKVTCADGSSYPGSMVIGADGAHSTTRKFLRELAVQAGEMSINDEDPFITTFRAIWMRFPTTSGLKPGDCTETHGLVATTQLFTGPKSAVIGLYERLDKPTRERTRYTKEDEEAMIKRWAHLPITPTLTVGEAYNGRAEAGLINLEEGVLKHWHYGRIVLAGDAAHKFTPSTGQGCNVGIVDIAVLVNALRRTLEAARVANGPNAVPSQEALAAAFTEYQSQRFAPVSTGCTRANMATATATWENTTRWFLDCFVLSWHFVQNYIADGLASIISQSPILDFIEWDDPVHGKHAWTKTFRSSPLTTN